MLPRPYEIRGPQPPRGESALCIVCPPGLRLRTDRVFAEVLGLSRSKAAALLSTGAIGLAAAYGAKPPRELPAGSSHWRIHKE